MAGVYSFQIIDGTGAALGVARWFESFLDERHHDDLRWYLEEYMELPEGRAVARAERVDVSLDT